MTGTRPEQEFQAVIADNEKLRAEVDRLRVALERAGKHINSLRDEHSERDTTNDPFPSYIQSALTPLEQ